MAVILINTMQDSNTKLHDTMGIMQSIVASSNDR